MTDRQNIERAVVQGRTWAAVALCGGAILVSACVDPPGGQRGTAAPTSLDVAIPPGAPTPGAPAHDHHSAAGDDKGLIDGWFAGRDVQLYYTKTFFCAEPPASGAPTNCEIGAGAEVLPRPGARIPRIYAIAPAGFVPDLATLSCPPNSVCLNHPAMIDASRVLGPGATNVSAVPHSHIVEELGGGWRETVNIRVRRLDVWNAIASAKSLARVRELQADPAIGGAGLITADTPTNIFFFIASWRE